MGRRLRGAAVAAPLACVLVACGTRRSRAAAHPIECARAGSDSVRAVCVALDTISRAAHTPARVLTVERTADGFRIRTVPVAPMSDGMGLALVRRDGRIVRVVLGDSL